MIKQLTLLPIYVLNSFICPKIALPSNLEPSRLPQYTEANIQIEKNGNSTVMTVNQPGTYEEYEDQETGNYMYYYTTYNKIRYQNENALFTVTQFKQRYTNNHVENFDVEYIANIVIFTITTNMTTVLNVNSIAMQYFDDCQASQSQDDATECQYYIYDVERLPMSSPALKIPGSLNNYVNATQKTEIAANGEYCTLNTPNWNTTATLTNIQVESSKTKTYMLYQTMQCQPQDTHDRTLTQIGNCTINMSTIEIPITVNSEYIDLPGLMFQILSMPFAFISQAFNLTLFPGTNYQINIANTLMVFLGVLAIAAILKVVIKIFL